MNLQAKLWQISFRDESGIGFETINPEYLGHLWGILEAIRRSRANPSAEKLEKSRKKLIGLKVFRHGLACLHEAARCVCDV